MEGRIARSQVVEPEGQIDKTLYSHLIRQGFRRSGTHIYRPHCDHCVACKSIRIPVAEFQSNRSQRRTTGKYSGLTVTIGKPFFSEEHYALYQRYQHARHKNGGMDSNDVAQYKDFLIDSDASTWMVEFRTVDSGANLRMVSIVDMLDDGLSAVYAFFDPSPGESYGTFNVLWQIDLAVRLSKPYVYLGYWIEQCQKMSYKTKFQPNELFADGIWKRFLP
jgi:arginine-tRNA-protein transferase